MRRMFEHLRELAHEFQRRRVYHAAAVYVVVAGGVLSAVDLMQGALLLGDRLLPVLGILAVVGFPVTLVCSWLYESTSEGIKADRRESPGIRLLFGGVVIVLSVGLGAVTWRFWIEPRMREVGEGVGTAARATEASAVFDPARVAVLYLDDHSDERVLGGLADRLTEQLTDRLTRIRGLEVVGRTSVKSLRERDLPFDSLLGELQHPGSVVEGSLEEWYGDSVRVTLQLIDATNTHRMSEWLTWPSRELYSLADTLAGQLVPFLQEAIGSGIRLNQRRSRASSNEAWLLAQRARDFMEGDFPALRAVDEEAARRVILRADSLLTEAIRKDEGWADPYVDRGWGRLDLARLELTSAGIPDPEWIRLGLSDAGSALERDPESAPALELRGSLRVEAARALSEPEASEMRAAALEDFHTAVQLDPGAGGTWLMLAELKLSMGDYSGAREAALGARSRDSFLEREPDVLFGLFTAEINLESFENAWAACDAGRERSPGNANFVLCRLMLMASDPAWAPDPEAAWSALDTLQQEASAAIRAQFGSWAEALVAVALVQAGLPDSARAVLVRAADERGPSPAVAYTTAYAELLMGNASRALDLLALYIAEFPGERAQLAQDWWFRPVWDSIRFRELVEANGTGS